MSGACGRLWPAGAVGAEIRVRGALVGRSAAAPWCAGRKACCLPFVPPGFGSRPAGRGWAGPAGAARSALGRGGNQGLRPRSEAVQTRPRVSLVALRGGTRFPEVHPGPRLSVLGLGTSSFRPPSVPHRAQLGTSDLGAARCAGKTSGERRGRAAWRRRGCARRGWGSALHVVARGSRGRAGVRAPRSRAGLGPGFRAGDSLPRARGGGGRGSRRATHGVQCASGGGGRARSELPSWAGRVIVSSGSPPSREQCKKY